MYRDVRYKFDGVANACLVWSDRKQWKEKEKTSKKEMKQISTLFFSLILAHTLPILICAHISM